MKKTPLRKLTLARETVLNLNEAGLGKIQGGTLTFEGGPSCWPECPRSSGQPNCLQEAVAGFAKLA